MALRATQSPFSLHRRRRRGALGRHEDPVRRRVRALDDRNFVAGVQFRAARQLESVLRGRLGVLCAPTELLPGAGVRAFVDIDSLLRPVYGHAKQGASFGHTKIAGKQVLRRGCPVGHHDQHRVRCTGDRRDAVARGQVGLG